jgi:hypothetical protein
MRIRWTPAAADDLEQISNYLSRNNPQFRQSTMLRLYEDINALTDGHSVVVLGARKGLGYCRFLHCRTCRFTAFAKTQSRSFGYIMLRRIGLNLWR